jgi:chorismate--pyruvate lyase
VVLLLDGSPAVWARSATTRRAVQGPWRALQGLGTRPLAELLFVGRQVRREPLRTWQLPRGGPEARHIRQQWQGIAQQTPVADQPRWARSSVFWQHGHALRVMEAFSPWVLGFGAPKGRAG